MNDYRAEELPGMDSSENQSLAVLVVEDEYLIRMDTSSLLEEAGFIVYEAYNAAGAIRFLELHDEIRLLSTDVNMPGSMNGLALAHYVRGRWPSIKIIVTSGYKKMKGDEVPAGALFIEKPYHARLIAKKMKDLIA